MAVLLAACVTSYLICFILLPLIIKYTVSKNLVDVPGRRKIHKNVTPSLGGIAIFVGFLVSVIIWMDYTAWEIYRFLLSSLFVVFLIGVRDDLVPFRALHKLYGQFVAITIFLFSSVSLQSFYGLFGFYELPPWFDYIITGFIIVVVTNSFNLIDGLDGLAGSIGIVALTCFGIWFFWVGDVAFALCSFALAGGILAFLVFNWQPAEIFMGDTGAMVIGMMLSILVLRFLNVNNDLPDGTSAKYLNPIAAAASFIIVPLTDTLRIVILRLARGQSPFKPDKSHIHHAMMRLGLTHSQTAVILGTVNLFFIMVAFSFRQTPDNWMLIVVIVLAGIFSFMLDKLITHRLTSLKA